MKLLHAIFLAGMLAGNVAFSQSELTKNAFVGSAYRDNISYSTLNEITTFAGGRLAGSPASAVAREILQRKLDSLGIKYFTQSYDFNAWRRDEDHACLVAPFKKELRAYAAGYSAACTRKTAEIAVIYGGQDGDYADIDVVGKAILLEPAKVKREKSVARREIVRIACERGAACVLFPSSKKGGMVLMSAPSFNAEQVELPCFCISAEDQLMIDEQIKSGLKPAIDFEVKSDCFPSKMTNIRAQFAGKSTKKILLLAHYDSWDVSTGAIDNGSGTAVLLDIARLIKQYNSENYFTIECVWTDAEEIGILGAKKLAGEISDSVVAVLNMDMPGSPNSINIMGVEAMRISAEKFVASLSGYKIKQTADEKPWLGSDHAPFLQKGVPTVTFGGLPDDEVYHHYHDFGDTFDKANQRYFSDAAAILGLFALEMANNPEIEKFRLSREETKEMLLKFKLDDHLKMIGEWEY